MQTLSNTISNERRRFPREEIARRGWATFATGPRFEVKFKDISEGGALVELTTSRNFNISDNMALTIAHGASITASQAKLTRRSGKIVRVDAQQSQRRVTLAIKFNGPAI